MLDVAASQLTQHLLANMPVIASGLANALVNYRNAAQNVAREGPRRDEDADHRRFESNYPSTEPPIRFASNSVDLEHQAMQFYVNVCGNQHVSQVVNAGIARVELFRSETNTYLRNTFNPKNKCGITPRYIDAWKSSCELSDSTIEALCSTRPSPIIVVQARINETMVDITYAYRGGSHRFPTPAIKPLGFRIPIIALAGLVGREWTSKLAETAISKSSGLGDLEALLAQHAGLKIEVMNGNLQRSADILRELGVPDHTVDGWYTMSAGLYRTAAQGLASFLCAFTGALLEADAQARLGLSVYDNEWFHDVSKDIQPSLRDEFLEALLSARTTSAEAAQAASTLDTKNQAPTAGSSFGEQIRETLQASDFAPSTKFKPEYTERKQGSDEGTNSYSTEKQDSGKRSASSENRSESDKAKSHNAMLVMVAVKTSIIFPPLAPFAAIAAAKFWK